MKLNDEVITLNELCAMMKISRFIALGLIRENKIKAYKTGKRRWSILRSSVDEFMDNAIGNQQNGNNKIIRNERRKEMTRLTHFTLSAAMDKKTYKKVCKILNQGLSDTEDGRANDHTISELFIDGWQDSPICCSTFSTPEKDSYSLMISVDIEKLSHEMDEQDLLEPTVDNAYTITDAVWYATLKFSDLLPFNRFYISSLTYTSWINFPDSKLAEDYINLLNRSILVDSHYKLSPESLRKSSDIKGEHLSKYIFPDKSSLEYYLVCGDSASDDTTLVITVQEMDVSKIDRRLQLFLYHEKELEEHVDFFMRGYMDLTLELLGRHFRKLPYKRQSNAIQSIIKMMDDNDIRKEETQIMLDFVKNIPNDTTLGNYIYNMEDSEKDHAMYLLHKLHKLGVQPICISDDYDRAEMLPDILTLVELGSYPLE